MVFKEENVLSCPQKCKIVIVKSGEIRILCRVFYLNECYDSKSICFIDDFVQISRNCNEIKYVQELELIEKSETTEFKQVNIKVCVDSTKLDLNIIKTKDDLKNVVKGILKHCSFTSNCTIACDIFGITRIYVASTSDMLKYGTLDAECALDIEEILIEASFNWNQLTLGGLKNAEKKLEEIIISNIQYTKDQRKFPVKPSSQVLIYGPCGSGKSSLIHQMVNKFNCNLFEITGDSFKPYPGETEEELQKIFNRITEVTNLISSNLSIVLIENIELFCPKADMKMKENSHSSRIASLIYSILIKYHTQRGF